MKLLPGPQLMLIIIDGLGDRPIKELGGRTPLEAARTPAMDRMARHGTLAHYYPLGPGIPVGSGVAHSLLFEYSLDEYQGRGPLEALGMGMDVEPGDLAFRVNFATLNNREVVLDRRAERNEHFLDEITAELNEAFKKNPFKKEITVKHSFGHRGAVLVKGWKKEADIPEIDSQVEGLKMELPEGDREDLKLARWIYEKARKVMEDSLYNQRREKQGIKPANALLMRGAGIYREHSTLKDKTGLKCLGVATESLYLGAAKFAGMDIIAEEDDGKKVEHILRNSHNYDFFFLHFKKADLAGHDGKPRDKKKAIEAVDRLIRPLLELDNLAIAVTGDHATPCELKTHSGDPVPVLFWGVNVPRDGVRRFGERYARLGGAGQLAGGDIIRVLMNLAGRMLEFGK
jgi:2,3-bisphosphoglycerate-independent phosphoglycerate mutase